MLIKNRRGRCKKALAGLITLGSLLTMMPVKAMAWGNEGHQTTALIAFLLLTPRAQKNVLAVLQGREIVDASTWPDDIKRAGKGCVTPGAAGCNPEYRPETAL